MFLGIIIFNVGSWSDNKETLTSIPSSRILVTSKFSKMTGHKACACKAVHSNPWKPAAQPWNGISSPWGALIPSGNAIVEIGSSSTNLNRLCGNCASFERGHVMKLILFEPFSCACYDLGGDPPIHRISSKKRVQGGNPPENNHWNPQIGQPPPLQARIQPHLLFSNHSGWWPDSNETHPRKQPGFMVWASLWWISVPSA